jgi:hypothetical protein
LDDPRTRDKNFTIFDLSRNITSHDFEFYMGYMFNTFVNLGYCPECLDANDFLPPTRGILYSNVTGYQFAYGQQVYFLRWGWFVLYFISTILLLAAGVISLLFESMSVVPDVLGYVSTAARNSRYLHLPKYSSAMSGGERSALIGHYEVMMQDVKATSDVGKIALGMKHEGAQRIKPDRVYR